jgi:hypothetical protein
MTKMAWTGMPRATAPSGVVQVCREPPSAPIKQENLFSTCVEAVASHFHIVIWRRATAHV